MGGGFVCVLSVSARRGVAVVVAAEPVGAGIGWSLSSSLSWGTGYNELSGMSCASASSRVAVVLPRTSLRRCTARLEQWNGSMWTAVASPRTVVAGTTVLGASCVSATSCTAVGYSSDGTTNQTLIESWNGTAWSWLRAWTRATAATASIRCVARVSDVVYSRRPLCQRRGVPIVDRVRGTAGAGRSPTARTMAPTATSCARCRVRDVFGARRSVTTRPAAVFPHVGRVVERHDLDADCEPEYQVRSRTC